MLASIVALNGIMPVEKSIYSANAQMNEKRSGQKKLVESSVFPGLGVFTVIHEDAQSWVDSLDSEYSLGLCGEGEGRQKYK